MITLKKDARRNIKDFRKSLTQEDILTRDKKIFENMLSLSEYQNAENVFLYKSINNEAGTALIEEHAKSSGKQIAFPVTKGNDIYFIHTLSDDDFTVGYMGILEPVFNEAHLFNDKSGVVIVPGLAFDLDCNRTGYGKGFYDRFLFERKDLIKIGIAYDEQLFDLVEHDDNDIPLDIIVTDKKIIKRSCL